MSYCEEEWLGGTYRFLHTFLTLVQSCKVFRLLKWEWPGQSFLLNSSKASQAKASTSPWLWSATSGQRGSSLGPAPREGPARCPEHSGAVRPAGCARQPAPGPRLAVLHLAPCFGLVLCDGPTLGRSPRPLCVGSRLTGACRVNCLARSVVVLFHLFGSISKDGGRCQLFDLCLAFHCLLNILIFSSQ